MVASYAVLIFEWYLVARVVASLRRDQEKKLTKDMSEGERRKLKGLSHTLILEAVGQVPKGHGWIRVAIGALVASAGGLVTFSLGYALLSGGTGVGNGIVWLIFLGVLPLIAGVRIFFWGLTRLG